MYTIELALTNAISWHLCQNKVAEKTFTQEHSQNSFLKSCTKLSGSPDLRTTDAKGGLGGVFQEQSFKQ